MLEWPDERFPPTVEATAYFVVSEALTNVAKYAEASAADGRRRGARTTGSWSRSPTTARGGADPARGSGLRGLTDRIAALDGALTVDSPSGEGTRVRAELPRTWSSGARRSAASCSTIARPRSCACAGGAG